MKVSDYIADFLVKQGVGHVFVVTGGCIIHAIDSISKRTDIKYVPVQHEQAGAIAAEAYARVTGGLGAAFATSGPGATNLLTGVCCAYYDSIPTIFVTGQVPTGQLKRHSMSRQIGFQETDIVSIFEPVTKYAVLIDDARRVRYEFEKAIYLARSGRPGPVLIDICEDIQRSEMDPASQDAFTPPEKLPYTRNLEDKIHQCFELMRDAKRPILVPGGGIRVADAVEQFKEFAQKINFPIVPTWAAVDFIPYQDPKIVGTFGVSSERAGNFAVQNSDLILVLGSRLDTHETGPSKTFARGAKKIVLDIDPSELEKYEKSGLNIDVQICADIRDFFKQATPFVSHFKTQDLGEWWDKIAVWKSKYPICQSHFKEQKKAVNPYAFMDVLSAELSKDAIVIPDCGGNLIWTMQGFRVRGNQRVFSAFNHSPMGYSIPASMGAAFATDKQIICITGDGGCQMNIQELATIAYYKLPVKIFLINNHGHGIMRQAIDTWLHSRYSAINEESGLAMPNLVKVAEAYGIKTMTIQNHEELQQQVREALRTEGPIFCNVELLPNQMMEPKVIVGRPIEDASPLLDRKEFFENMIVKPLEN